MSSKSPLRVNLHLPGWFPWVPDYSKQYFTIVQELYKLGFVTIMWDENRVASMTEKGSQSFEIVFRRSNLAACLV